MIISASTYSQELEISGNVRDKNNNSIAGSSVLLLRTNDSLIVNFGRSDQHGNFSLKYSGSLPVLISVQKVGYHSEYRTLIDRKNLVTTFRLLRDTILHLDEVVVNIRSKIAVKGDTTSYHLDAFRVGGERKLEEALARLPGFEIQENGKISVNGRPIQKILVEGDDLVSGRYTLLSKNLSPDLIEDVQLIDNFLDDPFFKTSSRSDDIALNLRFKEKFKSTFLTDASLELGTTDRYNANVNNIFLSKGTKLYLLSSMNNIGNDISNDRVEIVPRSSLVSSYQPEIYLSSLTDIGPGDVPRLERRRWFNNKSRLLSVNVNQPLTTKLSMKLNAGIGYVSSNRRKIMSSQYILSSDSVLTFIENHDWNGRELSSTNDLQVNYQFSSNKRLRYELKADISKGKDLSSLYLDQSPVKQALKVNGLNVSNSLNYVNRFKDRSFLSLDFFYRSYHLPQDYEVHGYDYSYFFPDRNIDSIYQEVRSSGDFLGTRATYYFTVGGLQVVGRSGFERSTDDLFSYLSPIQRVGNIYKETNNSSRYRSDRKYIEVVFERNLLGKIAIMGILNLAEFDLNLQSNLTTKENKKLFFLPDVKVTYSPSRKSKFVLGIKRSIRPPSIMHLYGNPILSSYRYGNSFGDSLFFRPTNNLSLDYRFNDPYNQLSVNAKVFYTLTDNSFISNNEISNEFNISKNTLGTDNKNLGVIYGISKFIPSLSTTAKFSGSFFSFRTENQVNGSELRKIDRWTFDNNISIISSYSGIFNYIISFQRNTNRNRVRLGTISSDFNNSFHKIQLTADLRLRNGIYIQTMASRYQWNSNGTTQHPFFGVDGNIRKSIFKNKITLSLTALNVLNYKYLSFNQNSDYYSNETSYQLLNRILLIGARFSL